MFPAPSHTPGPGTYPPYDHSSTLFPVPAAQNYSHGYKYSAPAPAPALVNMPGAFPDPYLQTRYTSPLPVPDSPPRGRQPFDHHTEARRQTLLKVEEDAARRKRQEEEDAEYARKLDLELNAAG
jgi:hypothetical protein